MNKKKYKEWKKKELSNLNKRLKKETDLGDRHHIRYILMEDNNVIVDSQKKHFNIKHIIWAFSAIILVFAILSITVNSNLQECKKINKEIINFSCPNQEIGRNIFNNKLECYNASEKFKSNLW